MDQKYAEMISVEENNKIEVKKKTNTLQVERDEMALKIISVF